jgi:hypothetical protein
MYDNVSLPVSVDFRPLLLIANVVFPLFMYADITVESVSVDASNDVSVV